MGLTGEGAASEPLPLPIHLEKPNRSYETFFFCRTSVLRRIGSCLDDVGAVSDAVQQKQDRERRLKMLREELVSGRYAPTPLLRVWIPKSNGGQRPLGISMGGGKCWTRIYATTNR